MHMSSKITIVLFVSSMMLLSSCAVLDQARQAFRADTITGETIARADEYINLGEYKKGLAVYAGGSDIHPNRELLKKYMESGDAIRNAADRAYQRKDFAKAGGIYNLLLESGIIDRDSGRLLSFDSGYLNRQIRACSKALTEIGLMKYREEKLDEAITIWAKILSFDRDNGAVIKAVETANKQRQQLKIIK